MPVLEGEKEIKYFFDINQPFNSFHIHNFISSINRETKELLNGFVNG